MVSDEVKRAYVERTKAANYQASLRLEGFTERKISRSKTLEEAVVKYRQLAVVQNYCGE